MVNHGRLEAGGPFEGVSGPGSSSTVFSSARTTLLTNEADKAAVAAAIVEPWSSGQVEGNINRFKLIKRQMVEIANLDLLKARLMAAA